MNTFDYEDALFRIDPKLREYRELKEKYVQFNTRNAGNPSEARKEMQILIQEYRSSEHEIFREYHFERIFSDYTGATFYQYLQQMRINYAQTLLSNPELSITEIAYQAGFASQAAFTRAFKKNTGYLPSLFRTLNEVQHPLPSNPYFASK